jgi:hypothetical protein
MALRRQPRVGEEVTISYLAVDLTGVIEEVDETERRLRVVTEDGESLVFTLDAATASFVSGTHGGTARLRFR